MRAALVMAEDILTTSVTTKNASENLCGSHTFRFTFASSFHLLWLKQVKKEPHGSRGKVLFEHPETIFV